jgi:hypothetical protein
MKGYWPFMKFNISFVSCPSLGEGAERMGLIIALHDQDYEASFMRPLSRLWIALGLLSGWNDHIR